MLWSWIAIGVPVVFPSNKPERISALSGSFLPVVTVLWPGLRLSRSFCMSSALSVSPDGQPSITQPIAGPWDSPQVVSLNRVPNVFDMVIISKFKTI